MLKSNLVFDQSLAFLAGALTPLLPLLDSNKPVWIMGVAAILGGVTGLRLFRNTAFAENQAVNRAESLASASEAKSATPTSPLHFSPDSIPIPIFPPAMGG